MDRWFTVEEIDVQTYAISEYQHWEQSHCYLLCGQQRAALIDTGLGVSDIRRVVNGLTKLPVTVLTTHAHWDHIGGHQYFNDIAIHEEEKDWLSVRFPLSLQEVKNQLMKKPCGFPESFDPNRYRIFRGETQRVLHDNDRLDLGGRTLQVVHTPGHSPGHCCFYERERKTLYSGDLIYKGCLYAFYPTTDPRLFYRSVKKLNDYEIDRVFPGHNELDIPTSLIGKIEEGFAELERNGQLEQGNGLFAFGDYQIWI